MERLKALMEEIELPKGHHVLCMGKVEKDIFFIKRGIARAYTSADGEDTTFWIGEEGDTLVSMNGYVNNQPGYESVELMEPSVLYRLRHADRNRADSHRAQAHLVSPHRRVGALQPPHGRQSRIPAAPAAGQHSLVSRHNAGQPEPHQGENQVTDSLGAHKLQPPSSATFIVYNIATA